MKGIDPDVAAELQGKADTLFKGESLRAMLLNAYGWWTVATIALWAGVAMLIAGLLLGILSILGFRHSRKVVFDHGATGEQQPGVRDSHTIERAATSPGRFMEGARL